MFGVLKDVIGKEYLINKETCTIRYIIINTKDSGVSSGRAGGNLWHNRGFPLEETRGFPLEEHRFPSRRTECSLWENKMIPLGKQWFPRGELIVPLGEQRFASGRTGFTCGRTEGFHLGE